jgi:hypothetical protein
MLLCERGHVEHAKHVFDALRMIVKDYSKNGISVAKRVKEILAHSNKTEALIESAVLMLTQAYKDNATLLREDSIELLELTFEAARRTLNPVYSIFLVYLMT